MTNVQQDYAKLKDLSRKARLLEGISHLLEWDQETYMPKGASPIRGEQIETLAGMIHQERTGKPFFKALSNLIDIKTGAIKRSNLKPAQKAALTRWRRDYLLNTSLPESFVKKFARITSEAIVVWDQAKKQNDFALFLPTLRGVIALNQEKANYYGYKEHPYDALLEIYEPDMTAKIIEKVFAELKKTTLSLLARIQAAKQVDDKAITSRYNPDKQFTFGKIVCGMIGYSEVNGRMDLSSHPFSSSSHPSDSRITTRIIPNLPISNIRSILHECGHAFYEMGLPEEEYGTPLGEPISLGIHESQSRFWETRIGQSRPFWNYCLPHFKKHFKGKLEGVGPETLWKAVNKVQPSLIRVEADEVTYALHVMIRFELEKALIEGSLDPADLPEAWNHKMEQLLGVKPRTDREGCLQDIHWSMGAFGYFPTYALGNLYAAQFFEAFEKAHPNWEKQVEKGEFGFIRGWLTDQIHQHGRRYTSHEILRKVTGKAFTSKPFEDYITNKYTKIYCLR